MFGVDFVLGGLIRRVRVSLWRTSFRVHLETYIWPCCGVHISALKSLSRWKLGRFNRPSQGLHLCWAGYHCLDLSARVIYLRGSNPSLIRYSLDYRGLASACSVQPHCDIWGTALVRELCADPRHLSDAEASEELRRCGAAIGLCYNTEALHLSDYSSAHLLLPNV